MATVHGFFIVLLSLASAKGSAGINHARNAKPQTPALTTVDGKLARYLEAPDGAIDGVVLANGTVARFAPRRCALLFRKGEAVRVQGDLVRGLPGPYLVHASVRGDRVPSTSAGPWPQPGAACPSGATPDADDQAHGSQPGGPRATEEAGTAGPAGKPDQADDVVIVESARARAHKGGRWEGRAARALRRLTTGTNPSPVHSEWRRAQEDDGP